MPKTNEDALSELIVRILAGVGLEHPDRFLTKMLREYPDTKELYDKALERMVTPEQEALLNHRYIGFLDSPHMGAVLSRTREPLSPTPVEE